MILEQLRAMVKKNHERMVALNELATTEKRQFTDAEREEFDSLDKENDAIRADIKRKEELQARARELEEETSTPLVPAITASQRALGEENSPGENYERAFIAAIRGNPTAEQAELVREFTLNTGTSEQGGILVPPTIAAKIVEALRDISPLRVHASVMATKGTHTIPISDTKPTFGWIDELGKYPQTDASFKSKVLDAHKAGGIIKISEELLADNDYDLEGYIVRVSAESLEDLETTAFISGDGVKKPTGLATDITNTTDVAVADTVTLDEVENLYLAIPQKYRKNAVWQVSEPFFKAVFKMKNGNGDRIYTPGLTDDQPATLFGRPMEVTTAVTGASGEPTAIFGDFRYYQIGDRGQMRIQKMTELYAETGEIGFKLYKRLDGKCVLPEAMAMLKNK